LLRIHCQEPWFSKIRAGIKRIEGRKYSPKYAALKPGDLLEFYCNDQSFISKVIEVKVYNTLEEYLETEGYENALPEVGSLLDAIALYLQYNSREELNNAGGFLAIHIQVKF
jgi:ASC-1-like (ASCH) protein